MKIIVLDVFTLNPGDISWAPFKDLGEFETFDRTSDDELVDRVAGAECILINKVRIDRGVLNQLPKLRYVGVLATGTNCVDLQAAKERGVVVTNVPDYGTESVAQHTFALLLELTNRVGHHAEAVRQGRWSANLDWCFWDHPIVELSGLNLGIIGLGRIGRAVGRIATAFGMDVLAAKYGPVPGSEQVNQVDLDILLQTSDVVTLHCPFTRATRLLINRESLQLMKPAAFLINTSRGQLVDEGALAEALNTGRIAGAGLDVLSTEPPHANNPLFSARNCIITPHLAWGSRAARERLMNIAADNLRAFIAGQTKNMVNV